MRIQLCLLLLLLTSHTAHAEWPQDAHDAQRTGYTAEEPKGPWKFVWSWNGPDEQGGSAGHFYDAPREGRTITGDGKIFVPAGEKGLYALELATGRIAWHQEKVHVVATPAYEPKLQRLFAAGKDGELIVLYARDGHRRSTYEAGAPITKSLLITDNRVFACAADKLHCVDDSELRKEWVYEAGSPIATAPAYSAKENVLLFATEDLHIHAVDAKTGKARWRVKPTPNKAGFPNSFAGAWPVVAEKTGVVFFRMRLDHDAGLWKSPRPKSLYPDTNAETRAYLVEHPELQNLFALQVKDGQPAFIPAVGYGGVEDLVNGKPFLAVGPSPVIRRAAGEEVAYLFFRNGQSQPPDGRWDSHLGEMKLTARDGLVAGDLRFVEFPNSTTKITDEQVPLTMAGETVFRAHWGASESMRIVDRSLERGLTFHDPIRGQAHPPVVRRQTKNAQYDPATHWTTSGLTLFKDGRYWNGPGWWVYWNTLDPPTPERNAYSDGLRPRYTYVSDGYVIVQGNGGELFVLKTAAGP